MCGVLEIQLGNDKMKLTVRRLKIVGLVLWCSGLSCYL